MSVADTNLIVYLPVPGQYAEVAEAVFRKDAHWSAPLLWHSEFRNAPIFYLRRKLIGLEEALDAMEQAEQLMRGQEFAVESSRVLRLAGATGCSAYDCESAALAQDLGVPLVTADTALIAKFRPTAVSMRAFCS